MNKSKRGILSAIYINIFTELRSSCAVFRPHLFKHVSIAFTRPLAPTANANLISLSDTGEGDKISRQKPKSTDESLLIAAELHSKGSRRNTQPLSMRRGAGHRDISVPVPEGTPLCTDSRRTHSLYITWGVFKGQMDAWEGGRLLIRHLTCVEVCVSGFQGQRPCLKQIK